MDSKERKRAQEELRFDCYSKYGTTVGRITGETGVQVKMGFVGACWPSWAIGARQWGCLVLLIIIKDSLWMNLLGDLFPDAKILLYHKDMELPVKEKAQVSCWMCDIDPPRKLDLWNSNATVIITMRKAGTLPSNMC